MTHRATSFLARLCILLCISAALPAAAQTVIGRVLVASGDVVIIRGGVASAAPSGTELRSGDTVRTGAAANAQILFTDTSVVALRASTEFEVQNYRFDSATALGAAQFNLVRGGFRTLTGLIGKGFRREDYAVKARTATIGIRGTHYSLVSCQDDCDLGDGTRAPNGTYGGVYEGRVGVSNRTPEIEFGRDEYFFVPDLDSIPQPLLGPPTFLADRLAGLAKNAAKPSNEPPASTKQAAAASTTAEEAPDNAVPYTATDTRGSGGTPVVLIAQQQPPPPPPPAAITVLMTANSQEETSGAKGSYNFAQRVTASQITTSGTGPSLTLQSFNLNPGINFSGAVGMGGIDMAGFDTDSGIYYGRWIHGTITNGETGGLLAVGTQTSEMGVHYLFGTATPDTVIASKTGTVQYNDFVGTTPTSSLGETTNSFSFGHINVNFTARTGMLTSVQMQFPSSTWNFSNLPFSFTVTPGQPVTFDANIPGAGSCVGSGCGPVQGSNTARGDFFGTFYGTSGNFLGLSFQGTSGGSSPTSNTTVGVVRIFKCTSCP